VSRIVPCGEIDRQTGGQTDIAKLAVAFRNFANAPKIASIIWGGGCTVCSLSELRKGRMARSRSRQTGPVTYEYEKKQIGSPAFSVATQWVLWTTTIECVTLHTYFNTGHPAVRKTNKTKWHFSLTQVSALYYKYAECDSRHVSICSYTTTLISSPWIYKK